MTARVTERARRGRTRPILVFVSVGLTWMLAREVVDEGRPWGEY